MSALLRHTFVQLHSLPLLQTLEGQLQAQLDEAAAEKNAARKTPRRRIRGDDGVLIPPGPPQRAMLPRMPPTGDLQLEEVHRADYFFS